MFWRANFCSTRRLTQTKFLALGTLVVCLLFYLKYKSLQDSSNAARHHQQQQYQHSPRLAAADADSDALANHPSLGDDDPTNATHFEALIAAELGQQRAQLGDNGREVILTGEALKRGQAQMKLIALNEEVSLQLRYNRTLLDVRNPLCHKLQYDLDALPTASVVIIFFNEPYSVLVRTVHSVIANSDVRLLKEIILVDDFSDQESLHGQLDYYMRTRFAELVKIVRLKSR